MAIIIILGLLAIGFWVGLFDDSNQSTSNAGRQTRQADNRNPASEIGKHRMEHNDTHFDPWTDEWYGTGPWWKKW